MSAQSGGRVGLAHVRWRTRLGQRLRPPDGAAPSFRGQVGIRIRTGCCGRRMYVAPLTREQHYWVIRPLLDAGMGVEHIRDLLFRLAFEGIVGEGRVTVGSLSEMVGDQPAVVQAAWSEVIGRMIAVDSTSA